MERKQNVVLGLDRSLGLIAGFVASKIVNKTGEGLILDIILAHHRSLRWRLDLLNVWSQRSDGTKSLQCAGGGSGRCCCAPRVPRDQAGRLSGSQSTQHEKLKRRLTQPAIALDRIPSVSKQRQVCPQNSRRRQQTRNTRIRRYSLPRLCQQGGDRHHAGRASFEEFH
jgi:hypothetical protein